MLKKMLIVAVVLAMAGTVFGGWASKFSPAPSKTKMIDDPCNPGKQIEVPNEPEYTNWYNAQWGTDRSVDWEKNTDNSNITQRKGEVWNWPASYDFVPIGQINVRMEIGFWIRLDCKDKQNLTLKQRAIDQYGGQTTCKAYTNVATEWKAEFANNSNGDKLGGKREAAVDPSSFDAKPNGQNLTIKMKIWEVSLANMTPSKDCVDIGTITIKVRPTVRPNTFMSGCSGSYPVYSPPPTNSDITWW